MRQVGGRPAGREGHGLHQLGGSGSVDVGMKDFLREVKMSTKEVCAVWQEHNQEKNGAVKASDIRSAVSKVVSTLHVHCAEIINEEAILAVQVASKMQPALPHSLQVQQDVPASNQVQQGVPASNQVRVAVPGRFCCAYPHLKWLSNKVSCHSKINSISCSLHFQLIKLEYAS